MTTDSKVIITANDSQKLINNKHAYDEKPKPAEELQKKYYIEPL